MPKLTVAVGLAALGLRAAAQVPDVSVKLDAALTYRTANRSETDIRTYTTLAQPSYASLVLRLEQGFNAVFSERFERIRGDGDSEHLLEYYVEDPGIWRLGKQQMPFGCGNLVRFYSRAARGDTDLPFIYEPIQMAIFDDGSGRSRGVMARAGDKLGFSAAFGRNLGIQSGVLAPLKNAEFSLGRNRGFRQMIGADFTRRLGLWKLVAEAVFLREGEDEKDRNKEATDLVFILEPNAQQSLGLGWARDWGEKLDMYRIEGRFKSARNLWFEPVVRYRAGSFFDLGLSLRARL